MAATKKSIIKKIKKIIAECGNFGCGEVEANDGQSVAIGKMGGLLALAEYFNLDNVEIEVYDTTSFDDNSVHSYKENYEDLSTEVLDDIRIICEFYEVDQLKTEKRISN